MSDEPRELTVIPLAKSAKLVVGASASIVVPSIIADAGDQAARRFLEFFAATIRNKNTRIAYLHAVSRFFAWCDHHQLGQLADIEPLHVAAYIEALGKDFEKPTVKQHLAAIRMLFDWLVTGQVVATNPAHAVRGPTHVVKTGKTTVLDADQARKLLDSIAHIAAWSWQRAGCPLDLESMDKFLKRTCTVFGVTRSIASWQLEHGVDQHIQQQISALLDEVVPQRRASFIMGTWE